MYDEYDGMWKAWRSFLLNIWLLNYPRLPLVYPHYYPHYDLYENILNIKNLSILVCQLSTGCGKVLFTPLFAD